MIRARAAMATRMDLLFAEHRLAQLAAAAAGTVRHGGEFVCGDPTTWGAHQVVSTTDTRRYGTATVQEWDRLHPRLTRRAAWTEHAGPLPIIEGTVIRLTVEH